jgi:phosphoesterase RecJ-like protein
VTLHARAVLKTPSHRLEPARRIAERLKAAMSIAVTTHVGGDGDGWGSACALAHHFRPLGMEVYLLAASPLPERFRFLLPTGVEPLSPDTGGKTALAEADVQVVVDASEFGRLGDFAEFYRPNRTIVIDHHAVASREIAASLTLIDPSAAATVELVYDVLVQTGDPIGADTAKALYVGLVTDTGSFRYSNSTPHSHRLAAALIEAGADPGALYRLLFANLTPADLGTLQAVLAGLHHDEELGITWVTLGVEVVRRFGGLDEYEGMIDHLRNCQGTEVAILLRQLESGDVKISLRSTGAANVASLARSFGGGGHEKAAGATVAGELAEVTARVLEACRSLLAGPPGSRS